MKNLLGLLALAFLLPSVQAQNIEGQIVASQFGQFQVPGITTGSLQFSPDSCMVSGGGKNFAAFSVGVPVKIVDANPSLNEIDTPSAVFPQQCAISMSTTTIHAIPFYLTSGTGGLQEALTNGPTKAGGPNTVVLNADWYTQVAPGNPATVIAAVHGSTALGLVDVTTTPYTWYQWSGSQYVAVSIGGGGANTPPTALVLKGNGVANGVVAATPNVDYLNPSYWSTLTGCATSGFVYSPPTNTCIAAAGVPGGSTTQVQFNNSGAFSGNSGLTFASNTLTAPNISTGGLSAGQVTTPILTLQEPSDLAVNIFASTSTVAMNMTIPATLPTSTNGTWVCGVPVSGAYTCTWGPNGGGSLPTASSIGQVPTSTGSGTTYTAQTPLGGTTWYYPVEWYGAVGDATGATGVGTDNTTAIQNAINAIEATGTCGNILLQGSKYRITSALTINTSCVGISGTSYGSFSTTQSNQLAAHVPVSAIVIDSANAAAVAAAGASISAPISFNKFDHFTIIRTKADDGTGTSCKNGLGTSVGAAGLSIQYAGGWDVDHVWSQDSACLYYYQNAGAYGTGAMTNSGGQWGANGFNPVVNVYGILLNGANSAESFRLTNSFIQTLYPGYSGVQSIGFLAAGPKLNDIFLTDFETAFMTYGKFFLYQGSGTANSVSDIHLWHCVDDSFFQNGTVISGLVSANGAQVEINGGWETTGAAGASSNSAGVLIQNSTGVTVSNVGFGQNGTQEFGVQSIGSSHISITGNRFLDQHLAAVALGTTSDATVTGNVFEGLSGNTSSMILGTSLTRSAFAGNTLGGFATTGVSLDSGSSNNAFSGVQAIDPANITTQVSNSGTNNSFDGVGNLIAKKTGAGTPATITFSSIPQTYQNLRLEGNFIITSGSNLAVIFNSDSTAAHYAYGLQYQASNTPGTLQSNSAAHAIIGAATGIVTMDIPSYANATAGGVNFNGLFSTMTIGSSTENGHFAGLWNGTDVTSITFEDVGGSALFTAPSTFSLYGLN